ncbi:MAG: hypothetical protein LBI05_01510 [Planctomycetaceae bacterium]|jgi:hypothetical protein|nr:hypothetical protein [Planctomycetaceae bacterium]
MSYHDAINYLAQKTSVIELYDQLGGRVAVCPEWNGRVLTSTDGGLEGDSFGFVNVQAIDTDHYEDFGGEDLWTISPLIHSFSVESIKENKAVLQRTLPMTDANGTHVEFHLTRSISMLNKRKIETFFDETVAESLEQENVSVVGFRSENAVWSQEKAWVASRLRGMFNASPHMVIIVATPPEDDFALEPPPETFPAEIDYLGGSPHGRIRHLPQALLIRADGQGRCQTTMPCNAVPMVGAVERRSGTLTLWTFDLPGDSDEDVTRIYNSGRTHPDEQEIAAYYEVNCFSATKKLHPEQSFTYSQCTLHINADNPTLDHLVRHLFSVSMEEISRKMFRL